MADEQVQWTVRPDRLAGQIGPVDRFEGRTPRTCEGQRRMLANARIGQAFLIRIARDDFLSFHGAFFASVHFHFQPEEEKMRACFLGQNICALGFGVATLQTPPLVMDSPADGSQAEPENWGPLAWGKEPPIVPPSVIPVAPPALSVTNPPRLGP